MDNESPIIKCRAKLCDKCQDGEHEDGYVETDMSWQDDSTYNEDTDTIVCDACYVALGVSQAQPFPMIDEAAIEAYKLARDMHHVKGVYRDVPARQMIDTPYSRLTALAARMVLAGKQAPEWQSGDRVIVLLSHRLPDGKVEAGIAINEYDSIDDLTDDISNHVQAIADAQKVSVEIYWNWIKARRHGG